MPRGASVLPMNLASVRVATAAVCPTAASQLIIAHGLLGNAGNWATAARRLVDHPTLRDQIRCAHTLDMRNHGASPHSPDHSNAALASDLEAFVLGEQRELHRAFVDASTCTTHNSILIGHSMGGLTVMGTLLRRANEDRLLPTWVDDLEDGSYGDWAPERRHMWSAGMRAVNDTFSFGPTQHIEEVLYNNAAMTAIAASSPIASRIPRLGRVSGAVIVDVTPTMRLGEQRTGADNVQETLMKMTQVRLEVIHNYKEAAEELTRVGMADKGMRDFVTTNLVLDPKDKSMPARWRCNLPVLAGDYGSFQPSITSWFTSAAASGKDGGSAVVPPKPCTLPVLFVFGGNSPYNEPLHRASIAEFFPNSTQVEVEGAGHFVHYEKTKAFTEAVAPFIASLTASP